MDFEQYVLIWYSLQGGIAGTEELHVSHIISQLLKGRLGTSTSLGSMMLSLLNTAHVPNWRQFHFCAALHVDIINGLFPLERHHL